MSLRSALEWLGLRNTLLEEARLATPLGPLQDAVGLVRVRGTIVPPATPLQAMFGGAPCVFWGATYLEQITAVESGRGGAEQPVWRQHFRSGHAMPFEIVDATGARAHVEVDVAQMEAGELDPSAYRDGDYLGLRYNASWKERDGGVELTAGSLAWKAPMGQVTENPRLNAMPTDLDAFLRARGVLPTQYMGLLQEHKFLEAALFVGMPVEIIGDARQGLDARGVTYRGGLGVTILRPRFISFVGQ